MFYLRLALVFVGIIGLVLVGRAFMVPDSWGKYGYYRGNYINEEASRILTNGTNESCKECHIEVYEMAAEDKHEKLSCEACHGPVAKHAADGKKIGDMPVTKSENQKALCLKCHQQVVGRPDKIKMIELPKHLEDQKVKLTHTCDQCHVVHAPYQNMKMVKQLREEMDASVRNAKSGKVKKEDEDSNDGVEK
ncbi:MAG: multiheme c-type cytochrome [Sulfurospirillaceae bacterium]|nr:multiheme c-type cytochrome [Sulfurospirillaceae bacterium]MDD3462331.1 multiheme c-type cytochrome [Sulfurospirillaceae bacterium]